MRRTAVVYTVLALTITCSANVTYVDQAAPQGGDGTSWSGAYRFLQDALREPNLANDRQIWVAAGVYKPDRSGADPNGNGSRYATFQLVNGVGLYGGFTGVDNVLEERDWQTNETILSGDLLGDDGPGQGDNSDENSYHIVAGSGTDSSAVLDGFTITAGRADGSGALKNGGGMYTSAGGPTVKNCTFRENSATFGGGMYNSVGSPTMTNCTFSANFAGRWGGGMYNSGAGPTLTNCIFSGNSADNSGGMHNSNSDLKVANCTFTGNSAVGSFGDGGGMYNWGGTSIVSNCIFTANSAGDHGGGIYFGDFSSAAITNCIFWEDTAAVGPEIALNEDPCFPPSVTVSYCDVGGGQAGVGGWGLLNWGHGNITTNPLFVDPNGLDGITGTVDDNLRLSENSLCIDAGDSNSVPADMPDLDGDGNTAERLPRDLEGRPRFIDDPCTVDTGNPGAPAAPVVDIGAYEFGTYYCGDAENPSPVGDINFDCGVDLADFTVFALAWLTNYGEPDWNINSNLYHEDATIDTSDLNVLGQNWLTFASALPDIAHWTMNDNTDNTTVADSIGGNDGTARQNTSILHTTGQIDGALTFDGASDYIDLGSPAASDNLPADDFTVSAWIYDESATGKGIIIGVFPDGTTGWILRKQRKESGGYIDFWVGHSTTNAYLATPQGSLGPDTWHHVVVVWEGDAKTCRLYIDGFESSYVTNTPGDGSYISDASYDKEIGRMALAGGIQFFAGKIDDVKIFDRALSDTEIEALYNQ